MFGRGGLACPRGSTSDSSHRPQKAVRGTEQYVRMLIPVAIYIGCLCVGLFASAHWLPDLADGTVGGLAFFAVCGLLGAASALVGLHIYSIVHGLGGTSGSFLRSELVASGLNGMLWETGSIAGIATAVYLLAPPEITDQGSGLEGTQPD
jgi:hypothetical protein